MNNDTVSDHFHLLRHMLGINTPNDPEPRPYRNYGAFDPDDERPVALEENGLVESYDPRVESEWDYYRCTDKGIAMACASHGEIRNRKSTRRYAAFRKLQDALPELTFQQFLTEPEYKDIRSSC